MEASEDSAYSLCREEIKDIYIYNEDECDRSLRNVSKFLPIST
jgi:hypothetical protein